MNKADKLTNKSLEALEKKIYKEYSRAYLQMQTRAKEYFYGADEVVDGRVIRRKSLMERLAEEEERYKAGRYTEEEWKNYKLTQIARGQRYNALVADLSQRITETNQVASGYINDNTPSIYSINQRWEAYEIGKGLEGVAFNLYDENTVRNMVTNKGNYTEFRTTSINPVRDYEWNSKQIRSAVTASILSGSGVKELTNSFMGVMKRNRNSAVRNARTAYTSAQNGGRMESLRQAKAQGIHVKKQWLSAHDGRVRDSHAMLDGQIRDLEEKFDNGLLYPADSSGAPAEVYNCRCTLTYIYPEWDDDESREIYRSEALEGETFEQFAKRMSQPAEMLIREKTDAKMTARQNFEDTITISRAYNNLPIKVRQTLGDVILEKGYEGSACDIARKTIRCRVGLTEEEVYHEYGHLIEKYMMDRQAVDEYKDYLFKGASVKDIYISNDYGDGRRILFIRSNKLESEYQSRIYADYILDVFNSDGDIRKELLAECVSEVFRKYMNGESLSKKSREMIERVVL